MSHHLLPLTVRLLHRTQLLEQPLAGESGHHQELILGKEVINELLLHFSCLARTKKAEVRNEQEEEQKAVGCSWRRLPALVVLPAITQDVLRPQYWEVTCVPPPSPPPKPEFKLKTNPLPPNCTTDQPLILSSVRKAPCPFSPSSWRGL